MNCDKTKIRNPKTNRCVDRKGKLGLSLLQKKCKSGQIVNPETGRCVAKSGAIGRKLRKAVAKEGKVKSKAVRCKNGEILNPVSGRCVSKSGAIGKRILKAKCKSGQIFNPVTGRCKAEAKVRKQVVLKPKVKARVRNETNRSLLDSLDTLRSKLVDRVNRGIATKNLDLRINENCTLTQIYKRGGQLGKGAEGAVYRVVTETRDEYVLKVSNKIDANFKVEAAVYKRLSEQKFKHAPIVMAVWSCKRYGYVLMEGLSPIRKSERTKNFEDAKQALDRLHGYNIIFPDAHDGNFMRRRDGTLVIIDYGWAYHFTSRTEKVKNRHRDLYGNLKFSWEQVLAWEQALVAQSFGTPRDKRMTEDVFARVMPASA